MPAANRTGPPPDPAGKRLHGNPRAARPCLRLPGRAVRRKADPTAAEQIEDHLIFLGLAALSDPVRAEVPDAIRACHTAGIRVIMITGDYALTAASIGEQIGLARALRFKHLRALKSRKWTMINCEVFSPKGKTISARVTPEHKLRIVSSLKTMGEIVAVTGDGVNDAPALKKADIGIAMGLRGSDVAKEAAT